MNPSHLYRFPPTSYVVIRHASESWHPGKWNYSIKLQLDSGKREAMFKQVAASIPAKRIGKAEEIAQTVLYLMTNGYTTGSTLCVDGGTTLR